MDFEYIVLIVIGIIIAIICIINKIHTDIILEKKKVLSLNPKLVKAHQLLALLYIQEDKLELAKKTLRNAGKIDTDNTTTLRYLKEVNTRLKEQNKRNIFRQHLRMLLFL